MSIPDASDTIGRDDLDSHAPKLNPLELIERSRIERDRSSGTSSSVEILNYEMRLNRDPRWALIEGGLHFEEKSSVFLALKKIARRLDEMGVSYAVVGGMALFHHGLRRFTEDVDILVTRDDLQKIHQALDGLGYLPVRRGGKHFRDTEFGVRIEFLTTGEYPGDGKIKPVAFPDPRTVSFESDGVRYIHLSNLIELKLASGMTNPARLKDLADVQELIKRIDLPFDFSDRIHVYVREKYLELYNQAKKRYLKRVRPSTLESGSDSITTVADRFRSAAESFDETDRDRVFLWEMTREGTLDIVVATTDPAVAAKYDMIDEAEFGECDEDSAPNEGS